MKIIVIGDIHGRDVWLNIVQDNEFDKIVFLGDYFDSFDPKLTGLNQLNNFQELLQFKRDYPDRVILLMGNHDLHYLKLVWNKYSGFQSKIYPEADYYISEAIRERLLQMCYSYKNFLFTHAGITKTWFQRNIDKRIPKKGKTIEYKLNEAFYRKPSIYNFKSGAYCNPYGDEVCQGPLWVRPRSLLSDKLDGFKFIVGHTQAKYLDVTREIVLNDVLYNDEYLEINNEELIVRKIKRGDV